MKSEWQTRPLGEVCEIQLGGTPARRTASYWDPAKETDNVWLSISDLPMSVGEEVVDSKEYLSDKGAEKVKLVRKGTLLFSFKLSIGRIAFAGRDLRTNEAIAALQIKDSSLLSDRYLAWFLASQDWDQITAQDEKLKGKTLNKQKMAKIAVEFPAIAEQREIVEFLEKSLARIDRATLNSKENLAKANELFESYIERRLRREAEAQPTQTLSCVTELIVDCEHKTAPTQSDGFPSIRTPNIGKGHLILEGVNRVSESIYQRWTRRAIPKPSDLILAREAPAGNVGVIPDGERVCLGQRTVLTPMLQ